MPDPSYKKGKRCIQIKLDGIQCGSPALKDSKHCYFHSKWHQDHVDKLYPGEIPYIPPLEDANAVQFAIMQISNCILTNRIDGKTAGRMLYALQIASSNLKLTKFEADNRSEVITDLDNVDSNPLDNAKDQYESLISMLDRTAGEMNDEKVAAYLKAKEQDKNRNQPAQ
jgi:hypothetical protein